MSGENWYFYVFFILLIITIIGLSGCSTQAQAVYIPTKCKIDMPKKPIQKNNTASSVIEILKYSELLEKDLDFCVNGKK